MPAYGYARVSTIDQDLTLQREALHRGPGREGVGHVPPGA